MDEVDTELKTRARARIGTVLKGKYHVDSVLGVGGMAVVYVVTHRNQKRFALKILHPEISIRADIRQRFLREGYAANSLNHPGAVAIMDDDVDDDGAAFLVMELLEGATIDALHDGLRRVPPGAVLAIAHQLLDVLAAAHAKSIVHRDIKPANLFLQRDGSLKVLDFGIARVKDATAGASSTSTGTMLGTPAFMAPEQANGRSSEIDGLTDLWAVGATMFSLLTGEFVHDGESATHVMVKAATQAARSLAAAMPEAAPELVALIDRSLAFEKKDRWPSAVAMRDAIARLHETLYGAPISKTELVTLVADHAQRSMAMRTAHAATVSAEGSVEPGAISSTMPGVPIASGPTLPAEVVTGSRRVGTTTANPVESSRRTAISGAPPARRSWAIAVVVVAAAAVGGGIAILGPRLMHQAPPAATATLASPPAASPPAPPVASTPASVTVAVVPATAKLAIVPPTASVEVDGKSSPVTDGSVDIVGTPGSMHLVHVTAGKRSNTYPVLLTEAGPVPQKVELAVPPSMPVAGAPPKPAPGSPPAPPPPPAVPSSVSRTME